jgi:hypothetical protein
MLICGTLLVFVLTVSHRMNWPYFPAAILFLLAVGSFVLSELVIASVSPTESVPWPVRLLAGQLPLLPGSHLP